MEDAISDAQQTSSHATQGALTSNGAAPYSAAFEQNVLGILKMLNQTMQQMRANPSITQTEVTINIIITHVIDPACIQFLLL